MTSLIHGSRIRSLIEESSSTFEMYVWKYSDVRQWNHGVNISGTSYGDQKPCLIEPMFYEVLKLHMWHSFSGNVSWDYVIQVLQRYLKQSIWDMRSLSHESDVSETLHCIKYINKFKKRTLEYKVEVLDLLSCQKKWIHNNNTIYCSKLCSVCYSRLTSNQLLPNSCINKYCIVPRCSVYMKDYANTFPDITERFPCHIKCYLQTHLIM